LQEHHYISRDIKAGTNQPNISVNLAEIIASSLALKAALSRAFLQVMESLARLQKI